MLGSGTQARAGTSVLSRGGRLSTLAVVAVSLALVVVACGDGESQSSQEGQSSQESNRVVEAVRELQQAYAERDLPAVCAHMTEAGQRQAGEAGSGRPETCVKDLRDALELFEPQGGFRRSADVKVESARVDRDRALATVAVDDWSSEVELAREDGRWKLDTFFGTPPDEAWRTGLSIRDSPFPAVDGTPVKSFGTTGSPCAGFFSESYPDISGDCEVQASGDDVRLSLLTPFGELKVADKCRLDYSVYSDSSGRTWTSGFWVVSDQTSDRCIDVKPCHGANGRDLPWKGRIYRDDQGELVHEMASCFYTTIGFYTGPLTVRMVRDGGRWTTIAANADVGTTGFRFDGRASITPDLDIRAGSS